MPETYQTTVVVILSTEHQIIAHLNRRRSSLSSTISGFCRLKSMKSTSPSADRRRLETLEISGVPLFTPTAAGTRPLSQAHLTDRTPRRRRDPHPLLFADADRRRH